MSLIRIFRLSILYLKCFSARTLLEKGGGPLERPVLAELGVFWVWLLLYCCFCTFLFVSRKCFNVSVLPAVQTFGYLMLNTLPPQTCIAAGPGSGCQAHCSCQELLHSDTGMAQSQPFCCLALDARSLSWVCLGHARPLCFFLPFWFIQSHPLSKTMNNSGFHLLSNTLRSALHIWNISSCFLQHVCQGCLQAAQWI